MSSQVRKSVFLSLYLPNCSYFAFTKINNCLHFRHFTLTSTTCIIYHNASNILHAPIEGAHCLPDSSERATRSCVTQTTVVHDEALTKYKNRTLLLPLLQPSPVVYLVEVLLVCKDRHERLENRTMRYSYRRLLGHALRRNAAGAFGPDLAKKLTQLVKMEKNVMRSLEQVAKERMEVAVCFTNPLANLHVSFVPN